jgi:hypothetical protein
MSDELYTTVVTSENLAEFNAEKIGITTAVEKEPIEGEIVKEEIEAPELEEEAQEVEQEPEAEDKPKKGKPSIEKRFSELTSRAKAAEERALAAEQRLKSLEETKKPETQTETVAEEGEPQPDQFKDAFEYAKALAKYSTEQALKQRDQQEAEKQQTEARQKVIDAWDIRQNAVKQEIDDYEEVVGAASVVVSNEIRDAIIESEVGPRILYHLASHVDEAEALSKMSVRSALKELGKLEAKLEKTTEKELTQAAPVVKASKAPPPIEPVRSKSVPDNKVNADGEFTGTYDEYKQLRLQKKIR